MNTDAYAFNVRKALGRTHKPTAQKLIDEYLLRMQKDWCEHREYYAGIVETVGDARLTKQWQFHERYLDATTDEQQKAIIAEEEVWLTTFDNDLDHVAPIIDAYQTHDRLLTIVDIRALFDVLGDD
jgi:hypothetical protein